MNADWRKRLPAIVQLPTEPAPTSALKRLAWMLAIWAASVGALAAIAALIRLFMPR